MIEKDIRMVYKQDTGKYPIVECKENTSDPVAMEHYIRWLENKVIEITEKSKV